VFDYFIDSRHGGLDSIKTLQGSSGNASRDGELVTAAATVLKVGFTRSMSPRPLVGEMLAYSGTRSVVSTRRWAVRPCAGQCARGSRRTPAT